MITKIFSFYNLNQTKMKTPRSPERTITMVKHETPPRMNNSLVCPDAPERLRKRVNNEVNEVNEETSPEEGDCSSPNRILFPDKDCSDNV